MARAPPMKRLLLGEEAGKVELELLFSKRAPGRELVMLVCWLRNCALFSMAVVMALPGSLAIQAKQKNGDCGKGIKVLRDKRGKVIWLSSDELMKRATHCIPPPLDAHFHGDGKVIVEICVNDVGKVICARGVDGHPILRSPAVYSAIKWTFNPLEVAGQPVAFFGRLTFSFSKSNIPDKDDPDCTRAR